MKNGYIIQGPIVERQDDTVVLGWSNGKVTLHRRFIESVTYDAGEEKRLQEDQAYREQKAAAATEELALLPGTNEMDELPSTLDQLLKTYDIGVKPTEPSNADGQGPLVAMNPTTPTTGTGTGGTTGPGPSDDTSTPVTVLVSRPEELLGDRLTDSIAAVSLKPPKGWTATSGKSAFEISGNAAKEGVRPSLNVVTLPKGTLALDEYGSILKVENSRTLQNFEILREGPRDVAGQRGYQLVGRGSRGGQSAVIRQVLVAKGDALWLFSSFTQDESTGGDFALMDEVLKTVELSTK
jgi:hypothetical protein